MKSLPCLKGGGPSKTVEGFGFYVKKSREYKLFCVFESLSLAYARQLPLGKGA